MAQALRPLQPFTHADAFIGARVRAHRIASGMSQTALGARIRVSSSASRFLTRSRSHPLPVSRITLRECH
jgi:hypothetical protein